MFNVIMAKVEKHKNNMLIIFGDLQHILSLSTADNRTFDIVSELINFGSITINKNYVSFKIKRRTILLIIS